MAQKDFNMNSVLTWYADAPQYARDFVDDKRMSTAPNTIRIYVNNIKTFWEWLSDYGYDNSLKSMNLITADISEKFITDISDYLAIPTVLSTASTLSSLYKFLIKSNLADSNPFLNIERPKLQKSEPVRLTNDEKCLFLHVVETGENMPKRFLAQELSHGTRYRNKAIAMVLIDTDIKVSELVALNIDDVNLSSNTITINNGDKSRTARITKNTAMAVKDCIDMRTALCVPSDETALFVASQGKSRHKRISTQTIDGLIKKYAVAANLKNAEKISPNKLYSIYKDESSAAL